MGIKKWFKPAAVSERRKPRRETKIARPRKKGPLREKPIVQGPIPVWGHRKQQLERIRKRGGDLGGAQELYVHRNQGNWALDDWGPWFQGEQRGREEHQRGGCHDHNETGLPRRVLATNAREGDQNKGEFGRLEEPSDQRRSPPDGNFCSGKLKKKRGGKQEGQLTRN